MTKRIRLTMMMLLATVLTVTAESIGTWTQYPSYYDITEIAPTGGKVFVVASGNLYSYNPSDGEVQTYRKGEVLSDHGIKHIAWAKDCKRLIIAYNNSNIDIMSADGDVLSVPDIYQATIAGGKTIYDILVDGNTAYLSMEMGVVKMDILSGNIIALYKLGAWIDYCRIIDGSLYAVSTYAGCSFRGDPGANLLDNNQWKRVEVVPDVRTPLNMYDEHNGCWWTSFPSVTPNEGTFLNSYTVGTDGQRTYKSAQGWRPDGPHTNFAGNVTIHKDKVYLVQGNTIFKVGDQLEPGMVSVLQDGQWSVMEHGSALTVNVNGRDFEYIGSKSVAVDPSDENHVYVGAKSGLYEFRNGRYVRRYGTPEGIETASSSDRYTYITDMLWDAQGRLWLANFGKSPLKYLDTKAAKVNTTSLEVPDMYELTGFTMDNGRIWTCLTAFYHNRGLFCYDPASGQYNQYLCQTNQDGIKLTCTYFDTEVDSNGNVWVATTAGPLYLPIDKRNDTSSPLYQYKVPRNDGTNLADYLLNNISCYALKIDAADRKWIGTNGNGVYLISGDNNTELEHFTAENSPLLSNIIHDIELDSSTGVVWFATDKGLCSYKADVTINNMDMSEDTVWAYPNPVTPEHTGMITIVGIEPGSDVKILSPAGRLVSEGTCQGGSYQWDGRDKGMDPVASGIYMVHVARPDGSAGVVTKVAVVR